MGSGLIAKTLYMLHGFVPSHEEALDNAVHSPLFTAVGKKNVVLPKAWHITLKAMHLTYQTYAAERGHALESAKFSQT